MRTRLQVLYSLKTVSANVSSAQHLDALKKVFGVISSAIRLQERSGGGGVEPLSNFSIAWQQLPPYAKLSERMVEEEEERGERLQKGYSTLTYANVRPVQANAAALCVVKLCHGAHMGLK